MRLKPRHPFESSLHSLKHEDNKALPNASSRSSLYSLAITTSRIDYTIHSTDEGSETTVKTFLELTG